MNASCSKYIPNVLAGSSGSAILECRPVYSCSSTLSGLQLVRWWRFDNETEFNNFIDDSDKSLSDVHEKYEEHEVRGRDQISNIAGDSNETLELNFTAAKRELVGYYVPTFQLENDSRLYNGQKFTVYSKSIHSLVNDSFYYELWVGERRAGIYM